MGTNVAFNGGGVSAATIQTLAGSGSATKWNSVVETTGGLASTVTLAQALTAAAGTTVTVRNTGAGAVTVTPFAGDTITGQTAIASGGSVTYMAMAAGVVKSVQDVATTAVAVPLARAVLKLGADWLNVSANDLYQKVQFNTVVYDSDTAFSSPAFQYLVPKAGDYHTDVVLSYTNNGANSNDAITVVVRKNGASDALALRHNISNVAASATEGLTATLSGIIPGLLAGDVLSVEMLDADDIMVTTAASYWSIQQLPTATLVNAGGVPVTAMNHAVAGRTTTLAVTAGATAAVPRPVLFTTFTALSGNITNNPATGEMTLPAGTYFVQGDLGSGNPGGRAQFSWYLNGARIGQAGATYAVNDAAGNTANLQPAYAEFTCAAGSLLKLGIMVSPATSFGGGIDSPLAFPGCTIQQLAAGSVVDPGSLTPAALNQSFVTRNAVGYVTTTNAAYLFNTVQGTSGIPYVPATGRWTLTAGVSYDLEAVVQVSGAGLGLTYQWYNVTAAASIGSTGVVYSNENTSINSASPVAKHSFTPAVTTVVELRPTGAVNTNGFLNASWACVRELPAFGVTTPNTAPVITDITLATGTNANVASALAVKTYVDENTQAPVIKVITANGTYTPTAGLKYAIIRGQGAGGGGGGCSAPGSTTASVGGAGGAGAYIEAMFTAAQLGASQTVTIGAAGTAGAVGNNAGGTGGVSSFGALISIPGGIGGNGSTAAGGTVAGGGLGGAAPTLTGGTAITAQAGRSGGSSFGFYSSNPAQVVATSGNGADSHLGRGGQGRSIIGGTLIGSASVGQAAGGSGAGGSGGVAGGGATAGQAGGAGAPARFIVVEYF